MSGAGSGRAPRDVPAWPEYDVERTSVRAVMLDAAGRLLLFDTGDPQMPETGRWWELPGGGMEPGEDVVSTVRREVREETGIVLRPDQVSPARWHRDATYVRRHVRVYQHEHVVVVRLDDEEPAVGADGRTEEELEQYLGHRWWTPAQVAASRERFFPASLPDRLGPFLRGDEIIEPFEHWN